MFFAESGKLFVRCGVNIEPIAFKKLFETAVEFEFVVDVFHIRGVVETLDKRVVDAPCNNGLSLRAIQVVHLKQPIVHVTRLIFQTAVYHIEKEINFALSGLFMYVVYLFEHLIKVHRKDTTAQIFYLSQNQCLLLAAI